jgi:hypothetical protein
MRTTDHETSEAGRNVDREAVAVTSLPTSAARLLPWLGAAIVVAVATLAAAVFGTDKVKSFELTALLVGLCATLTTAGLVAARASRLDEANEREERARPARDELSAADGAPMSRSYLAGMEQWADALQDLVAYAIERTEDRDVRSELRSASDDTAALLELLRGTAERQLGLSELATLHSVCALWETNQERIEALAAAVDPPWHRRWRARAVIERLLRHGPQQRAPLALPYRS